jgi:hypothetical protein
VSSIYLARFLFDGVKSFPSFEDDDLDIHGPCGIIVKRDCPALLLYSPLALFVVRQTHQDFTGPFASGCWLELDSPDPAGLKDD